MKKSESLCMYFMHNLGCNCPGSGAYPLTVKTNHNTTANTKLTIMKKILLNLFLIGVFCHSIWGFSQAGFIPPSPQSFSFVKATNVVSENEHTGSANVNIPLFTYKANKLSTDVSILYSGAGVKVDDLPNDVGMTWIIDAGGVITRTVNGLTDEKATMRMNKSEAELIQKTASDCAADEEIRAACYTPFQMDTERDIFDFRFSGVSGSFYFDANFVPVFLKNDSDVKIFVLLPLGETNNRNFTGFELITKEGIKYVFGGSVSYWETTASKAMPANPPGDYAISSYFLKEIEYMSGEKIFFTYENTDLVVNKISEINSLYLAIGGLSGGFMPNIQPEIKTSTQNHYTRNKKRLQSVTNNQNSDQITFVYKEKADSEFNKYLSGIEYKVNNTIFKKIDFDYLFEDLIYPKIIIQRFFLTTVQFYNKNVFEKKYQFNYNNPFDLPPRMSYSQDMFGYFNGKGNNSLIAGFFHTPLPPSASYSQYTLASFGDRRPDFYYSTKGVLKEVIYPTGGKTNFEYEAPKSKALFHTDVSMPDELFPLPMLGGTTTKIIENLDSDQYIGYTLSTNSSPQSPTHMNIARFEIRDMDTNQLVHSDFKYYGYAPSDSITGAFSLYKNKRYKISFTPWGVADLRFSYTHKDPVEDFGIRLKSVTHSENNQISEYKRFYYHPASFYKTKEENLAINDFMTMPDIQDVTFIEMHDGLSGPVFYALHNSGNSSELYNSKLRQRYTFVTTSLGGDNFENGGYQKSFKKDSDDPLQRIKPASAPGNNGSSASSGLGFSDMINGMKSLFGHMLNHLYFPAKGNRLYFSGTLNKIRYFNKKGNIIYKNKEISYRNRYNILDSNPNLFISQTFDDLTSGNCSLGSVQRIANFYISIYKNYTVDTKLEREIITDYIDEVPLTLYNNYDDYFAADSLVTSESAYRKLITTIDYNYEGMPAHSQLTKQTLLSSDGRITETHYQYAKEKNNQYLIGKNIIGVPLETETRKDGKVISKTQTLYPVSQTDADTKTSGLALPYSIVSQNLLTGLMDADVRYDRYDSKGNLLQYTTKEGIPVSIIWGYNQTLPIAKVEGVLYSYLLQFSPETADMINASNMDFNAGVNNDETALLSSLQKFRTRLSNDVRFSSLVSTYTYDPLIGVRSITPPSGIRENYLYDAAGRLEKVIDMDGKILKEMKYNYKN